MLLKGCGKFGQCERSKLDLDKKLLKWLEDFVDDEITLTLYLNVEKTLWEEIIKAKVVEDK